MDLAIAVASGGQALGSIPCEQGDVLYIDPRTGRAVSSAGSRRWVSPRTLCACRASSGPMTLHRFDQGFIEALDDWRGVGKQAALGGCRRPPAYQTTSGRKSERVQTGLYDYGRPAAMGDRSPGLLSWCFITPARASADDPLEALSGSNGLSACADTTLVLDKKGDNLTLYVRGRDVEEKESALKFTSGIWDFIGDAVEVEKDKRTPGAPGCPS